MPHPAPELPPFYLRRPPLPNDPATLASYQALWELISASPTPLDLTPHVPSPRWPFLAYLAENAPVLLHGSADATISELTPRQSNDIDEFGNREAVYAASDGIWPIFFAIVDRSTPPVSLMNACFRVVSDTGPSDPVYFFSLNADLRAREPWRAGTIYILPRTGFEAKPAVERRGQRIQIMEWASSQAVRPLATISVGPADFPFLAEIRGHDLATVQERAAANPAGFPWLDPV